MATKGRLGLATAPSAVWAGHRGGTGRGSGGSTSGVRGCWAHEGQQQQLADRAAAAAAAAGREGQREAGRQVAAALTQVVQLLLHAEASHGGVHVLGHACRQTENHMISQRGASRGLAVRPARQVAAQWAVGPAASGAPCDSFRWQARPPLHPGAAAAVSECCMQPPDTYVHGPLPTLGRGVRAVGGAEGIVDVAAWGGGGCAWEQPVERGGRRPGQGKVCTAGMSGGSPAPHSPARPPNPPQCLAHMSAGAASFLANSGSFFSSSG